MSQKTIRSSTNDINIPRIELEKLGIGTQGNTKLRFKDKRESVNTIDQVQEGNFDTNTAKFNSFDYGNHENQQVKFNVPQKFVKNSNIVRKNLSGSKH